MKSYQPFSFFKKGQSFTLLALSSVFINLLSLALPFAMLQIYDRILPNQSHGTATVLVVGVAIAILIELLLRYLRSWVLAASAADFEFKTTSNVVERLIWSDKKVLVKMNAGSIFNSLSSIATMRDLYSGQVAMAVLDFPFLLLFLGLVAYIGGPLVFVPIFVWIVVFLFVYQINKKLTLASESLAENEAQRSLFLIRLFSHLIVLMKALSLESTFNRFYREKNFNRLNAQQEVDWLSAKLQEVIQGASQVTTLGVVFLGCLAVLDGQLTTGGLAACSILAGRAVAPLSSLIGLQARVTQAKTAMKEVEKLASIPVQAFIPERTYEGKLPLGPIVFSDVSYQSLTSELKDFSLTVEAGTLVTINSNPLMHASAVIGLIALFYEPKQGSITINDLPLLGHNEKEFSDSVLHVPVWPILMTGSVIGNMTLFQSELEEEAIELAHELGLTSTLSKFQAGFSTKIDEDNRNLLGAGSLKLISLIRAVVQKPSILLIEEPMLSLDADSQERVIKLFTRLKGEMTIITLSYDPALEAASDLVVALPDFSEGREV